jgi:hypothetical protein
MGIIRARWKKLSPTKKIDFGFTHELIAIALH